MTHAVRAIDLPQYDTDSAAIGERLREFLTDLRERCLLVAGLAIPPLGWTHGMSLLLGFGEWL